MHVYLFLLKFPPCSTFIGLLCKRYLTLWPKIEILAYYWTMCNVKQNSYTLYVTIFISMYYYMVVKRVSYVH